MAEKRVKIIKYNNASVKFEVDSRYSPLESIGTGAYGVVCAAKDNRSGQRVAIKKIPKIFDVQAVAKRTYRELKILRHLRHENIISILDVMKPSEEETFEDVYVVLDLMESDLHHIIHSVQPLSNEHIKYFLYQILCGLKYIHSANVLHRDLKPSNLLINQDCELKIGDFGMARGLSSSAEDHSTFMTEYVATRWYRAPELMLSFSEYTFSIDMWSVGCIFAEMLARRHLFPGKNYLNQLQLILSVVGTPSEEYIRNIGTDRVKTYLQNLPVRKAVDLTVLFPEANSSALDLLKRMLVLNPKGRASAIEALEDPYLSRYHDPKEEPVCSPPFDFSFEKELISTEDLRKAIFDEIDTYHKCKLPIPSQDIVKDALIKMMKDRDQEKAAAAAAAAAEGEGAEGGTNQPGTKEKEGKTGREGTSKSKKDEKKKKRPNSHAASEKKKKIKIEPTESTQPRPGSMTEKDKEALKCWKDFKKASVTRNGNDEDVDKLVMIQQQQQLMRRQIEEQTLVIANQQKIIQEQLQYIGVLREQKQALVRECQQAGLNLSDIPSLQTPSKVSSSSQHFPLPPPPNMPYPTQPPSSQHLTLPPSQPQPSSPSLAIPPGSVGKPVQAPSHPPYPSLPHHSTLQRPVQTHLTPHQRPILPPPPPPPGPCGPTLNYIGLSHPRPAQTPSSISQPPTSLPPPPPPHHHLNNPPLYPSLESCSRNSTMPDNLTFSPLTSSEFREIDHKDQPPGYSALLLKSYDEELNSILDIAGLPTGRGSGYGVGVADDELPALDLSNLGTSAPAGPPSASLLQDWLDINQLDPDDMDVLQKELEAGAPDSFLGALSDL